MPFMPRFRPNKHVKRVGKANSLNANKLNATNRASMNLSVLSINHSQTNGEKDVIVMTPDNNNFKRKSHRFPRC